MCAAALGEGGKDPPIGSRNANPGTATSAANDSLFFVAAGQPELTAAAQALSRELGYPLTAEPRPEHYQLLVTPEGLRLQPPISRGKLAPLMVDFAAGELRHRRLYGANRSSLLARAIGAKHAGDGLRVLDATAGLGRDAFILASLGCRVLMLERAPVLYALLRDGLERARSASEISSIIERMQLLRTDARRYLQDKPAQFDVIYLDPMFAAEKRTALVKAEMRITRELAGADDDAADLLAAALAARARRVAVKRMRKAPALAGIAPQLQIAGKTNRFDVYLRPSSPP